MSLFILRHALLGVAVLLLGALVPPASSSRSRAPEPDPAPPQLTMMDSSPELERLGVMVGTWRRGADQASSGGLAPSSAEMVVSWGPGNVWMTWDLEIQIPNGQTIEGRRQIAWDAQAQTYRSCWIDSQSAQVIESTATWLDTNVLEIESEEIPWPDGRTYRFRTEFELASEDTIKESMLQSVDGGDLNERGRATWKRE